MHGYYPTLVLLFLFADIYFCLIFIRIPSVLGPKHAFRHDCTLVCFQSLNRLAGWRPPNPGACWSRPRRENRTSWRNQRPRLGYILD